MGRGTLSTKQRRASRYRIKNDSVVFMKPKSRRGEQGPEVKHGYTIQEADAKKKLGGEGALLRCSVREESRKMHTYDLGDLQNGQLPSSDQRGGLLDFAKHSLQWENMHEMGGRFPQIAILELVPMENNCPCVQSGRLRK